MTTAAQRGLAGHADEQIGYQNLGIPPQNARCHYLDWDSGFFGYRIARVTGNQLDARSADEVLEWCAAQKIDCLYFLAGADDDATIRLAERHRFHLVDIRATFKRELDPAPAKRNEKCPAQIRVYTATDIPALRSIARVSYHDTRFYYDRHFPLHLADALYETWIEKSCNGCAETVLVADVEGEPVGYISCQLPEKSIGQIGLVGVSREWNGQGLGQVLVNESLLWFASRGVERIRVVTQGRNCKAQRLYERSGFVTESLHLWYHRWFL